MFSLPSHLGSFPHCQRPPPEWSIRDGCRAALTQRNHPESVVHFTLSVACSMYLDKRIKTFIIAVTMVLDRVSLIP